VRRTALAALFAGCHRSSASGYRPPRDDDQPGAALISGAGARLDILTGMCSHDLIVRLAGQM